MLDTTKQYSIIYADPPWSFKTWSDRGKQKSPDNHYSCMSMADIKSLPVGDIAAKDSLLFMWVTDPLLDVQIETMKAWGFAYKTVAFTWVKLNKKGVGLFTGLGYYTRSNPEMVLLGRRGKPPKPKLRSVHQVVMAPVREHSRKPDEVRSRIAAMYDGPRLEMFARTSVPGWDVFGNEVEKFDANRV